MTINETQINKEDLIFIHRKHCLPLSPYRCQFTNLQQHNIFSWEEGMQLDMLHAMQDKALRPAEPLRATLVC